MTPWLNRWLLAAALAAALLATARAADAPAPACPPPPAPVTPELAQQHLREAVDRGYLFRATKDGRTSWVYGTIHVARLPWMFPGPRLREALQAADQVALELDMADAATVQRLMAAITTPPGAPPLPAALEARLRAEAAALCVEGPLATLRPELQAVTLSALVARRLGLEAAYGIDAFLAGYGRALQRTVVSLETPEGQAAMLVQPTPEATARFVARALDELAGDKTVNVLRRTAEAWAASDWDALASYGQWCGCLDSEDDRALMRRLLDERNGPMARRIAADHAAGKRVFAGVGALHLIGPQGLPALLAAEGFQVERVLPPPAAAR